MTEELEKIVGDLSTDEALGLLPVNPVFRRDDGCNYSYNFSLTRGFHDKYFVAKFTCIQGLSDTIQSKGETPKEALVGLCNKLILEGFGNLIGRPNNR